MCRLQFCFRSAHNSFFSRCRHKNAPATPVQGAQRWQASLFFLVDRVRAEEKGAGACCYMPCGVTAIDHPIPFFSFSLVLLRSDHVIVWPAIRRSDTPHLSFPRLSPARVRLIENRTRSQMTYKVVASLFCICLLLCSAVLAVANTSTSEGSETSSHQHGQGYDHQVSVSAEKIHSRFDIAT